MADTPICSSDADQFFQSTEVNLPKGGSDKETCPYGSNAGSTEIHAREAMASEEPVPTFTLQPILARTRTIRDTINSVAYDCVKLIFVRSGSAILFSEFGRQQVQIGNAVLPGANVLCGSEPADEITVTTLYLDTDYVLDQIFWQHTGMLHDRLDVVGFSNELYTEPAQILRIGRQRTATLLPWLDELVSRSSLGVSD